LTTPTVIQTFAQFFDRIACKREIPCGTCRGAVMVAIAVGGAPLGSAIPNQDNGLLCSVPAYQKAAAHFVDCKTITRVTGRIGHATVDGLPQTFYPSAVATTSAPAPPAFFSISIAMILASRSFRREPRWSSLRMPSLVLGVVALIATLLFVGGVESSSPTHPV
jgi:hypothetical protein